MRFGLAVQGSEGLQNSTEVAALLTCVAGAHVCLALCDALPTVWREDVGYGRLCFSGQGSPV